MHKKAGPNDYRINLDDEDEIQKSITRAMEGNQPNAWFLIHQLECALRDRRISPALFDHAARFFGALLDLREVGDARPKEFCRAFKSLYIVRPRGQPSRVRDEKACLAARVAIVTDAGYPTDVAIDALSSVRIGMDVGRHLGAAYKDSYSHMENKDNKEETLGDFMKRHLSAGELEVLAGLEDMEEGLVDFLIARSVLPPLEKQKKKKK